MFRNPDQKSLATLLARSSAIALIAAFMPLGIHLTDDGVTIDAPAAHAQGQSGGDHGQSGGDHGGGPGDNNDHGEMSSALGRGNAAHANENALLNAAPNSQVGKVAAYRDAVAATEAAAIAAAAAVAALPGLGEDLQAALDAQAALVDPTAQQIADAQQAVDDAQQAVDDANADIAALGVAEATEQAALEASVKDPTFEGIAQALQDLLGI